MFLWQPASTAYVTRLSQSSPQTSAMRASIRDIVAAIAFGNIVYRSTARGDETSPYGNQTDISPLERLYRLKDLRSIAN